MSAAQKSVEVWEKRTAKAVMVFRVLGLISDGMNARMESHSVLCGSEKGADER